MLKISEFTTRRKKLMQQVGPNGIVILASSPIRQRNSDYDYPYRQDSDFYYLTGFEEPESVVILAPKRKEGEFVLFNRIRNHDEEIWVGPRAGQEGACKNYLANQAFSIHELENKLPHLLEGREKIFHNLGLDKNFDQVLIHAVNKLRGKIRSGIHPPISIVDLSHSLHELRLIKSPAEINLMRKACEITADAHIRAMKFCKPGVYEYEVEAEILHEFEKQGARFPAYTSIVGSGANTCVLHYTDNNQVIKKNDLVLIDAGCEYSNYAADVTRTFPANGSFSTEQKAIYDIVLKAQLAAIKTIKPGASWHAAQDVTVKVITKGLLELGILKGNLKNLIEEHAYLPFYMHKSGHWLGLDVHDVGRYKINNKWRTLVPGMVLTVEPGIYLSANTPNLAKRWHNIGVRIEDDVLVTPKGHEVLTQKAPKTIQDIEALMSHAV